MLSVKLISELSPEDQAALPGAPHDPNLVLVIESRPGEMGEPWILLRRALHVLKAGKTVARDPAKAALKAHGLVDMAALRAQAIGAWSTDGRPYDPSPDTIELQKLAARHLGPKTADDHPIARFRTAIEHMMCGVRMLAAAQRLARARGHKTVFLYSLVEGGE